MTNGQKQWPKITWINGSMDNTVLVIDQSEDSKLQLKFRTPKKLTVNKDSLHKIN